MRGNITNRGTQGKRWHNVERVLVIYDDPGSQWTVWQILGPAGYDITVAPCGPLVMDVLASTLPELVVIDISLPGPLAQELCRRIRDKSRNVPLLVLSSISEVDDVVLLLRLGADGYITKPFDPLEFLVRVRAAMRHFEPVDSPTK